jgi:hypothetical protein
MMNRNSLFSLVLVTLAIVGISCSNQKSGGPSQAEQRIGIQDRKNTTKPIQQLKQKQTEKTT